MTDLAADARTIWTAACIVRGRLQWAGSIAEVRASLHVVSERHTNPNLAAIAGMASVAHSFMHEWRGHGEVISIS